MLDACVIYPTVMREVLLGCAKAGLYEPRWSTRILEEWVRATAKLGADAQAIAGAERAKMCADWPAALVDVPDAQQARFWLPDPNDIHVLASAVVGSCDVIVTVNAQDFPRNVLADEGLRREDPDAFLRGLFGKDPQTVSDVVQGVVAEAQRLSGDNWTARSLLKKARMARLGKAVEGYLSA